LGFFPTAHFFLEKNTAENGTKMSEHKEIVVYPHDDNKCFCFVSCFSSKQFSNKSLNFVHQQEDEQPKTKKRRYEEVCSKATHNEEKRPHVAEEPSCVDDGPGKSHVEEAASISVQDAGPGMRQRQWDDEPTQQTNQEDNPFDLLLLPTTGLGNQGVPISPEGMESARGRLRI
jgi:hypothetical protein